MNYPFIPIDTVTEGMIGDFPTLSATNKLNKDQMYSWAVECLRLVRVNTYSPHTVYLMVKNFNAPFPKNFYILDSLVYCQSEASLLTRTIGPTQEEIATHCRPASIMRPSIHTGNMHLFANGNVIPNVPHNALSYTLRFPPGIIKTSFRDGIVQCNFFALLLDERGKVLMQDEENLVQCVQNYIKIKVFQESFLLGETAEYIWREIKDGYENSLLNAQNAALELDQSEMDYLIEQQNARYLMFNL